MSIDHEIRVIQSMLRDHRTETQVQARELREDLAELGDAMRLEIARELVERVPVVRGEVVEWLGRYGLVLEGEADG